MTHRDITLDEDERTAALLVYLFACLAFACAQTKRRSGEDRGGDADLYFYAWVVERVDHVRSKRTFGDAVMWAMRVEGEPLSGGPLACDDPAAWLSYVEHVVGYRCGPGNGHAPRSW